MSEGRKEGREKGKKEEKRIKQQQNALSWNKYNKDQLKLTLIFLGISWERARCRLSRGVCWKKEKKSWETSWWGSVAWWPWGRWRISEFLLTELDRKGSLNHEQRNCFLVFAPAGFKERVYSFCVFCLYKQICTNKIFRWTSNGKLSYELEY